MDNSYSWRDESQIGMNGSTCILDQREEPSSRTQLSYTNGSEAPQRSYSQVGEQEEDTRTQMGKMLAKMETILQSYQRFKTNTEEVLVKHMEHILALEKVKSSNDEVISAQDQRIKMLEKTVEDLRTRLKNHQRKHEEKHLANLWRIKQANTEIKNLRESLRRVDSISPHPISNVEFTHFNSNDTNDSSEGEKVEVIDLKPDSRGEHQSILSTKEEKATHTSNTEVKVGTCFEQPRSPIFKQESHSSTSSECQDTQEDFSEENLKGICERLWEQMRDQLDDEKLKMLKELAQQEIEHPHSSKSSVPEHGKESSCREQMIQTDHFYESSSRLESSSRGQMGETMKMNSAQEVKHSKIEMTSQLYEHSEPVRLSRAGAYCSGCGLNCAYQLRVCVNIIKVQPSMKKVEKIEIKSMKSKHKQKLQKKWVSRDIFELQELCQIDSIISDVQCANLILPWWKKRHKRNPSLHEDLG